MNNYQDKKEQFTNPEKSKRPLIILVVLAVIAVAVATIFLATKGEGDTNGYFGKPVANERSYVGKFISMTTISPEVKDGSIVFPLTEVTENNIVYFELENDEQVLVPLMAYITPTGRLFVGSSMCEPCRGRTYSLAGETIVCDTCRTTYNIETQEFLSGAPACGKLPPIDMKPIIKDGNVIVDYDEVLTWRIRA